MSEEIEAKCWRVGGIGSLQLHGKLYKCNSIVPPSKVKLIPSKNRATLVAEGKLIPLSADGHPVRGYVEDPMPPLPSPDSKGDTPELKSVAGSAGSTGVESSVLIDPTLGQTEEDAKTLMADKSAVPISPFTKDPDKLKFSSVSKLQTMFLEVCEEKGLQEDYFETTDKDELIAFLSQDFKSNS